MTDRERWTIYPLLFFALALGFRSNYRNPAEFRSRSIECQSLVVRDNVTTKRINGRPTADLYPPNVKEIAPAERELPQQDETDSKPDDRAEQETPNTQLDTDQDTTPPAAAASETDPAPADESP